MATSVEFNASTNRGTLLIIDEKGSRFRVRFDVGGGFTINKTTDDGASEKITITAKAVNQIGII